MQNKHLEHPEDCILTGDLSVLDWMYETDSSISVKIDGAPAIVWGTNPQNGEFFVCTKAAFNKQKIRLCYNEDDIFEHFGGQPRVTQILIYCLEFLPKTEGVFQGDWIGFGKGLDTFRPNTITYKFPEIVREEIIIAPHTYYTGDYLPEMEAHPLEGDLISTKYCKFVRPEAEISPYREDIEDVCKFAKQMSTLCDFVNEKQAKELKKVINRYIREGEQIDEVAEYDIASECECDVNLIRLWKLVYSIKMDLFWFIERDDEILCEIDGQQSDHEGYVMVNDYGTFKIVDRYQFSRANFNLAKNW